MFSSSHFEQAQKAGPCKTLFEADEAMMAPPTQTPMHTHIRPHAPTLTLRHACARARTHVHANTLTVCTQADADGIGGLLSILAADNSSQATREPTLPELRVDLMQKAHAMFGGNVDFGFATQLLEVARSSPCACMPRLAARRATGAALALQDKNRDVDAALEAYGRFRDEVCVNVCTRTYTHIHTRMHTRTHAPVLCVQFPTDANTAYAADREADAGRWPNPPGEVRRLSARVRVHVARAHTSCKQVVKDEVRRRCHPRPLLHAARAFVRIYICVLRLDTY